MGWRSFTALGILIIALMVVGTPMILGMTSQGMDDAATSLGLVPPDDQDERDLDALRKKEDGKNAGRILIFDGAAIQKDGSRVQVYGTVNPDGTVSAADPATTASGRLPMDGGSAVTVTEELPLAGASLAAADAGVTTTTSTAADGAATTATADTAAATSATAAYGG